MNLELKKLIEQERERSFGFTNATFNLHRRELDMLLDAAERSLAMEWQPIETAPKDGTKIFALDADGPTVVAWMTEADLEDVDNEDDDESLGAGWYERLVYTAYHDTYFYKLSPTHWMPPPSPPRDVLEKLK